MKLNTWPNIGRFSYTNGGFSGFLNNGAPWAYWLRIGFGWDAGIGQVVFRVRGALLGGKHLLDRPWPW